jgi:chemotaxis protein CheC
VANLTEMRQDALAELFNIGVGQAAAALSEIVNDTIELSAPEISICSVAEARTQLLSGECKKVSAVMQQFSGPFDTQAMLVFPETHALEIVRLMINSADLTPEEISEYEQEAMCEVGNIILNACMCALADSFCATIDGGLPMHRFESSEALLLAPAGSSMTDKVILFLKVSILIRKHAVNGQIIFLMSIESLDALFSLVDQYLKRQGLA